MNKSIQTILPVFLVAGFASSLSAQNTLISGDLSNGANWDTGAPTISGNIGIINGDNVGANAGASTNLTGLFISQTGGDVTNLGGIEHIYDSTEYEISGGTLKIEGLALENGSLFTISGGDVELNTVNSRDLKIEDSTFTISSGSFITADQVFGASSGSAAGNIFNFSGGTFTSGALASGFNNEGTFNFSGTADVNTGSSGGSNNNRFFNFGLGSGTVDFTGTLNTQNMTLDWTSGSSFALTAAGISGAGTTYEELWDAGNLLVDGAQSGTFASNFSVTGNTLTLVPEPSAFGLLAGFLAFGWVMLRRRG